MAADVPKVRRVAHVVLYVDDPERSALWYQEILGMRVSARVSGGPYQGGVFLSFGEADHDIALFPAVSRGDKGREFEHLGLELDCEGDVQGLRRFYGKLLRHKVRIHEVLDHGVSVGIYFYEPDGHLLEVFCQLIPDGAAAIQELEENQGKADPVALEPLYD